MPQKTGRSKKNASHRLLSRLEKYYIETLSFMYDFSIPFENNLIKWDIRMEKLRQKISGCFRVKEGPMYFAGLGVIFLPAERMVKRLWKSGERGKR